MEVGIGYSLGYTEFFDEKVAINLINNKIVFANAIETINKRITEHIFNFQPNEEGKIKIFIKVSMQVKN